MSTVAGPSDDIIWADDEEIETLKAIYIKELEVDRDHSLEFPTRITLNLHPATADNADEQYVRLTLVIDIPTDYPNSLPVFRIRTSRGLSDEDLQRIYDDLQRKADGCRGSPMLYELIELAKEHLTDGNTPRCSCAICLYGFSEDDASFIKTECYHYFHSHCLRRYVECSTDVVRNVDEDDKLTCRISCPICREPITYAHCDLEALPPPTHADDDGSVEFVPDSKLLVLRRKMADLFVHQKSRGGIIDVEAERNKYLLEISVVPNEPTLASKFKRAGRNDDLSPASFVAPCSAEGGPSRWTGADPAANRKRNRNYAYDSVATSGRGGRAAGRSAGAPSETRMPAAVANGSSSHDVREGRRAPKRGSHHGRGRGRGRGGRASSKSEVSGFGGGGQTKYASQSAIDSADSRLLDDSSSRVNVRACEQPLPVNGQPKRAPHHRTSVVAAAQKCSADRYRHFHRPATTSTTT